MNHGGKNKINLIKLSMMINPYPKLLKLKNNSPKKSLNSILQIHMYIIKVMQIWKNILNLYLRSSAQALWVIPKCLDDMKN